MRTYAENKTRVTQLRSEKIDITKKLLALGQELNNQHGEASAALSERPKLEIDIAAGSAMQSQLDAMDERYSLATRRADGLKEKIDKLENRENLVRAAIIQIQKDVKANYQDELWAIYKDDFPQMLDEFEALMGKICVAQMGRSGIDGSLQGVIRWLVSRGELLDPAACFRKELESVGVFSNV